MSRSVKTPRPSLFILAAWGFLAATCLGAEDYEFWPGVYEPAIERAREPQVRFNTEREVQVHVTPG